MRLRFALCLLTSSLLVSQPRLHGQENGQPTPQLTPDEIKSLKDFADALQKKQAEETVKSAHEATAAAKQAATDAKDAASAVKTETGNLSTAVTDAKAAANSAAEQAGKAGQAESVLEAKRQAEQAAADRLQALQPPSAVTAAASDPLHDKVPCLMDRTEIYDSRGYEDPKGVLSPEEQLQIVSKIKSPPVKEKVSEIVSVKPMSIRKFYSILRAKIEGAEAFLAENANRTPSYTEDDIAQALQVADAPQTMITLNRPTDVGCSMSVYSWNIARMVFGRTVANNYLAVQVLVRNLDANHDYLIHDAELAVDAYSAQLERFQASNEREAVRAVVLYGQSYDRRAMWTNSVEAIGTILGAIVSIPSANDILTSATGAYTSGIIPSWHKLFPDLTSQNLNNVNDLGFSAAAASRIVVPKGGSVPFVVFVPLKPLEQACWLQSGYVPSYDVAPGTACSATQNNKPITDYVTVKYKKWQAAQITALQKHAYAVVAGMHIEDANATPAARSVTCDNQDAAGRIHVALLAGKALTCTLTGAGLNNVKTISALSIANPAAAAISASANTSGDSTVAKAIFSAASVAQFVDPSYDLHAISSSGTDTDLKQTLAVVPVPTIDPEQFSPVSIPAAGISSLTIAGTNLDQVTAVVLTPQGATSPQPTAIKPSKESPTSLTLNFSPVLAKGSYVITFQVDENKTEYSPSPELVYPAP